jgi:hypothetical protein
MELPGCVQTIEALVYAWSVQPVALRRTVSLPTGHVTSAHLHSTDEMHHSRADRTPAYRRPINSRINRINTITPAAPLG